MAAPDEPLGRESGAGPGPSGPEEPPYPPPPGPADSVLGLRVPTPAQEVPVPPPAEPDEAPRPPLKRALMTSAAWTVGGWVLMQALRFASNLILTRLLFPEAFGLMALVFVFVTGLHMF